MRMSIAFGGLLVLYSAAPLLSTLSQPASKAIQRTTSWLLVGDDEESQLNQAYERMGQGDAAGLAEAITMFTTLLVRNPASPYRWCDLGEALLESGAVQQARYCLSRAHEFGSHVAPILMRISNFHFRLGETRQSLQTMASILAQTADYDAVIFSYYDRMGVNTEDILDRGLPAGRRAAQSYFRHLLGSSRMADVDKTWSWVESRSLADAGLTCDYANYLQNNRAYEKAARAWAGVQAPRRGSDLETNYVFNGDFESEPAKCGSLDWNILDPPNVEAKRDPSVARSGKWSLRIRFQTEENLSYNHVSQTAYGKPGPTRFQAFLRTSEISTDQGVGFHIFDPDSPARLDIFTEHLTGTSDWRKVETTFVIPRNTRRLTIQVVRRPSMKFDNKIHGTVWIDDVGLKPADR